MQKYHDEPKQYKGYLKSALSQPSRGSAQAQEKTPGSLPCGAPTPRTASSRAPRWGLEVTEDRSALGTTGG